MASRYKLSRNSQPSEKRVTGRILNFPKLKRLVPMADGGGAGVDQPGLGQSHSKYYRNKGFTITSRT